MMQCLEVPTKLCASFRVLSKGTRVVETVEDATVPDNGLGRLKIFSYDLKVKFVCMPVMTAVICRVQESRLPAASRQR